MVRDRSRAWFERSENVVSIHLGHTDPICTNTVCARRPLIVNKHVQISPEVQNSSNLTVPGLLGTLPGRTPSQGPASSPPSARSARRTEDGEYRGGSERGMHGRRRRRAAPLSERCRLAGVRQ